MTFANKGFSDFLINDEVDQTYDRHALLIYETLRMYYVPR